MQQPLRFADVRKILVLGRAHIGDCLLTTPLLRALKRGFPRALLHVAVPESNKDLLNTNPHVDEQVFRPSRTLWGAKTAFALEVRSRNYDLIISLQEKSMFYAWTAWAARSFSASHPATIALDHRRTRPFYQYHCPIQADQHEVSKYLKLATMLGCPEESNPVLELEPTPSARERIDVLIGGYGLDSDTRFIGIIPGASRPEKRWAVERFAHAADRLHEELRIPVVIIGSSEDHDRASRIADRMKHQPIVMAGRTTLADTAALLQRCRLLITGDTGPMHIAVAMAVPIVALWGPSNPVKFGPFTTQRTILRHAEPCPRCQSPCLHTIEPEECVEAALQLYQAPRARQAHPDPR